MREDVVGDDDARPSPTRARASANERLVVVLPGVEEHDVVGAVEPLEALEGVPGDHLDPVAEAGVGDVPGRGLELHRVGLE